MEQSKSRITQPLSILDWHRNFSVRVQYKYKIILCESSTLLLVYKTHSSILDWHRKYFCASTVSILDWHRKFSVPVQYATYFLCQSILANFLCQSSINFLCQCRDPNFCSLYTQKINLFERGPNMMIYTYTVPRSRILITLENKIFLYCP